MLHASYFMPGAIAKSQPDVIEFITSPCRPIRLLPPCMQIPFQSSLCKRVKINQAKPGDRAHACSHCQLLKIAQFAEYAVPLDPQVQINANANSPVKPVTILSMRSCQQSMPDSYAGERLK